MFHFQLGSVGVFTGTLLGAEGEREQLTLSCSVFYANTPLQNFPRAVDRIFAEETGFSRSLFASKKQGSQKSMVTLGNAISVVWYVYPLSSVCFCGPVLLARSAPYLG